MEPGGLLLYPQVPATRPYPEPDKSSSCLPSHFEDTFNIIPIYAYVFQMALSFRFPHLSLIPLMQYPPTITLLLISAPDLYLVRSTDYKVPQYAVSSSPPLPRLSPNQGSSSAPLSRTASD